MKLTLLKLGKKIVFPYTFKNIFNGIDVGG